MMVGAFSCGKVAPIAAFSSGHLNVYSRLFTAF
jgi:hypothetical protein